MRFSLYGVSLAGLALAACQSVTPGGQPQAGSGGLCDNPYVPAVEGATWTSTVHTPQGDSQQVDTITDVGTDAFLVETVTPEVQYVITWSCTPDGLLWLQTDGGMFSAVFQSEEASATWETVSASGVSLPKNIQPGDTWSSNEQLSVTDSSGTRPFDISVDFQAVGTESVTVPAGAFDAMHIDLAITFGGAATEVTLQISDWFAAGVGLVKSSAAADYGNFELVLESYQIP